MEPSDLLDQNFESNRYRFTEDAIHSGSLSPTEAGSLQSVVFSLSDPERDQSYYVGLRAVDKVGKMSPVSNLVSFFIPSREEDEKGEQIIHHEDHKSLSSQGKRTLRISHHRSASIAYISLVVLTITGLIGTLLFMLVRRIRLLNASTNDYVNLLTA